MDGCCLLYQTRSQQSNSVLFLSNEKITPTFLIKKLTKHNKSPTLPENGWNMYANDSSTLTLVHVLADQIEYEFHNSDYFAMIN